MPHAAGLYYEEYGPADAPPLVLSSGLGGLARYWEPNIPALSERFRIVAYDHRGTGRSDRALPDAATTVMAADMLALLDALAIERAHVLGHALGGLAALELARMAPGRVDRLVVVNGWPSLDRQTARCFATRLTLLEAAGTRAFLEAQPLFLYPATWLSSHDDDLRAEAERQLAHWPGNATMVARIDGARAFDCRDWAGDLAAPVLLVSASDDLLVPWTCSQRLAELIGRERAVHLHLPWGAHACNVTAPDIFDRDVLDFLRS